MLSLSVFLFLFAHTALAEERKTLFREDFSSLENWIDVSFPKIKKHTLYTIDRHGNEHYLRAESNASASAIVFKETFDVYQYPRVTWRWKVSNIYEKGGGTEKSGDDYPIRIYVMFEFDPEKAGLFEMIRYTLVKKLYGEYPPQSTLTYVWANRDDETEIKTSPYTGKAKIIALQKGKRNVGTWQAEEVNIVRDYERAFGTKPPPIARIGVMNDSDNTGESSVSFIQYLEVFQ